VELATQELIRRLANSLEKGSPRPGRPRKQLLLRTANLKPVTRTTTPATQEKQAKAHYCKCGLCRVCQQNAEWEAKFNSRFGASMKDYYSGMRLTRQASWWSDM
jgi:hypothetical protein